MGSDKDLEPILSLDLYYNIRTHFVKRLYDLNKLLTSEYSNNENKSQYHY